MLHAAIQKRFASGGRGAFALDIAFDAPPQGVTILFGPSGSGKTTTLRAVAGIVTPDAGRIALGAHVFFDSQTHINLSIQQRRIGFVFQDYALFPHLTAEENVAFGVRHGNARARGARAREWLALFKLSSAANRRPRTLSGGEQQRVALARALASEPQLLLLDEPLSAVDAATRAELLAEIANAQRQTRIPFLYVTHNHAEALRLGDHLLVLHEGRIAQEGAPLDVFNRPHSAPVARAVGTENIFAGRVISHREAAGITLIEVGEGCRIEATYNALPAGMPLTVGVRAEDILIARERITQTSARNVLAGTITKLSQEDARSELLVTSSGVNFKVSITPATVAELGLQTGDQVYLLIKARAFHLIT